MKNYLSLIKFSHTIFALPFALVGFFWATYHTGLPLNGLTLLKIVVCMVFARSAAMAFNRYLDRDIDALNPRTVVREIPSGVISPTAALLMVIVSSFIFVLSAYLINPLCFLLSPVALLVILGYSYTKRFTWLCHFVLGIGLSLAPIGAYLAVAGRFDIVPILYSFIVLLWVSGFDIMYALQDEAFDKSLNLSSVPVRLGTAKALQLSNILHICCGLLMIFTVFHVNTTIFHGITEGSGFGIIHTIGAIIFICLLIYQHTLVKVNDLSKINLAFFTTNGIASVVYGLLFVIDYFY